MYVNQPSLSVTSDTQGTFPSFQDLVMSFASKGSSTEEQTIAILFCLIKWAPCIYMKIYKMFYTFVYRCSYGNIEFGKIFLDPYFILENKKASF